MWSSSNWEKIHAAVSGLKTDRAIATGTCRTGSPPIRRPSPVKGGRAAPRVDGPHSRSRALSKKPVQSPRIDVEIIFAAKDRNLRADVDNVASLILEALRDIVYPR
jgi:hypothetical protein